MTERFEEDSLEDLMEDAPEGSHALDELEAGDEAAEFDESEDPLEEFGDDELEESMDSWESEDGSDELEESMTDALEAEDADEFFGFLKKIGKGIGSVARAAAPFASLLPVPGLGAAANVLGSVLADEGDEFDAMEELADLADEEDGWDELSPPIATLAIRGALKHHAARIARPTRRKLVKTVTAVTKHIARRHGARAVAAVPAIVEHARRIAIRRRLSAKHLPALVARTARAAVKSPRVLRKLAVASSRMRGAATAAGGTRLRHRWRRRHGGMAGYGEAAGFGFGSTAGISRAGKHRRKRVAGGLAFGSGAAAACPHCQRRVFRIAGPVTLTIAAR